MNGGGNDLSIVKRRRFGRCEMPSRNDGFRKTLSPDPKANINQGIIFLANYT